MVVSMGLMIIFISGFLGLCSDTLKMKIMCLLASLSGFALAMITFIPSGKYTDWDISEIKTLSEMNNGLYCVEYDERYIYNSAGEYHMIEKNDVNLFEFNEIDEDDEASLVILTRNSINIYGTPIPQPDEVKYLFNIPK